MCRSSPPHPAPLAPTPQRHLSDMYLPKLVSNTVVQMSTRLNGSSKVKFGCDLKIWNTCCLVHKFVYLEIHTVENGLNLLKQRWLTFVRMNSYINTELNFLVFQQVIYDAQQHWHLKHIFLFNKDIMLGEVICLTEKLICLNTKNRNYKEQ